MEFIVYSSPVALSAAAEAEAFAIGAPVTMDGERVGHVSEVRIDLNGGIEQIITLTDPELVKRLLCES